ncbi:MAG: hypothetical protein A2W17_03055 [Planctomycetes bacterium RBG_16_41_13]|nr:MAG: hypothetical protein A2W17_03055 [Planctomycetes bacterium RBG_16_41_13]
MPSLLEFFKKLKCYKVLRFLSFEFVSYFDIRISNLVAAKGRAVPFVVKLFLVAALLRHALCGRKGFSGEKANHSGTEKYG